MKISKLTWFYIVIALLLFLVYCASHIILPYVVDQHDYLLWKHICVVSCLSLIIMTIIPLTQYFRLFSILLLTFFAIISIGQLYFIEIRMYNALLLIALVVALGNCVVNFANHISDEPDADGGNKNLIRGIIPLFLIGFEYFINSISTSKRVHFKENDWIKTAFLAGLVLAIVTTIIYLLFAKNREDKKRFLSFMLGVFSIALFIPALTYGLFFNQINYTFDTSQPTQIETVVYDKYDQIGRGSRIYYIVVDIDGEHVEFRVDKFLYIDCKNGSKLTIYQYDGAFNTPYYEIRYDGVFIYSNTINGERPCNLNKLY